MESSTQTLAGPDEATRVDQPVPAVYYRPRIGDVFVTSWGYDQTNVNAYIVVRVTKSGRSVYTKPAQLIVWDNGPTADVRPTYKVSTRGYDVLDYSNESWPRGTECPVAKLHRVQGVNGRYPNATPYMRPAPHHDRDLGARSLFPTAAPAGMLHTSASNASQSPGGGRSVRFHHTRHLLDLSTVCPAVHRARRPVRVRRCTARVRPQRQHTASGQCAPR